MEEDAELSRASPNGTQGVVTGFGVGEKDVIIEDVVE